jgi:hypothetical protein
MYIRVAQITIDPSRLDELIALQREQGKPVMRELPGVQSVTWGRGQGKWARNRRQYLGHAGACQLRQLP